MNISNPNVFVSTINGQGKACIRASVHRRYKLSPYDIVVVSMMTPKADTKCIAFESKLNTTAMMHVPASIRKQIGITNSMPKEERKRVFRLDEINGEEVDDSAPLPWDMFLSEVSEPAYNLIKNGPMTTEEFGRTSATNKEKAMGICIYKGGDTKVRGVHRAQQCVLYYDNNMSFPEWRVDSVPKDIRDLHNMDAVMDRWKAI